MVITVIEKTDNTREVLYRKEHQPCNPNIRTYWFQDVSPEELQKIQTASTDKVQSILSEL